MRRREKERRRGKKGEMSQEEKRQREMTVDARISSFPADSFGAAAVLVRALGGEDLGAEFGRERGEVKGMSEANRIDGKKGEGVDWSESDKSPKISHARLQGARRTKVETHSLTAVSSSSSSSLSSSSSPCSSPASFLSTSGEALISFSLPFPFFGSGSSFFAAGAETGLRGAKKEETGGLGLSLLVSLVGDLSLVAEAEAELDALEVLVDSSLGFFLSGEAVNSDGVW